MIRLRYLLILVVLFMSPIHIKDTDSFLWLETEVNNINEIYMEEVVEPPLLLHHFLRDLSMRESGGRFDVVNQYGYLGKFQFNIHVVRRLGFEDITKNELLNSHTLQYQAMMSLLRHNKQILNRQITLYDNTYRDGNLITESGILASAHLIGPYRTRLYLEYNIISTDGNGVPLTEYLYNFSGYNLNI